MAETDLAIIGCGASAVALLAQLARMERAEGMHVHIYERSGLYGRGVAYSTPHLGHLLNVRAANMSLYPDAPDDFARWAAERGYQPADFVPRKIYGDYLCERLEEAKGKLSISFIDGEVMTARKEGEGIEIATEKRKMLYPFVVQATGNAKPIQPKTDGDIASYHAEPYGIDYSTLKECAHIGLIGSGLSAVDAILALFGAGYKGKISVFSRHGLFPAAHGTYGESAPYGGLPVEGYEELSPYGVLRLLRMHVEKAQAQAIPWQSVIDALRPHINILWAKWTRRTREKFMKRLFTIWNVHRHRMAPDIAAVLHGLVSVGRIEIVKGNVEHIAAGPKIVSESGIYSVDAVISCMGYRGREEGRSFDVSAKIGPPLFGEKFETTAMPEIRVQAAAIIDKLLEKY
ncbi:MAG: FAD/NAD(P)-binding protein [Micavibrio sp.]